MRNKEEKRTNTFISRRQLDLYHKKQSFILLRQNREKIRKVVEKPSIAVMLVSKERKAHLKRTVDLKSTAESDPPQLLGSGLPQSRRELQIQTDVRDCVPAD